MAILGPGQSLNAGDGSHAVIIHSGHGRIELDFRQGIVGEVVTLERYAHEINEPLYWKGLNSAPAEVRVLNGWIDAEVVSSTNANDTPATRVAKYPTGFVVDDSITFDHDTTSNNTAEIGDGFVEITIVKDGIKELNKYRFKLEGINFPFDLELDTDKYSSGDYVKWETIGSNSFFGWVKHTS